MKTISEDLEYRKAVNEISNIEKKRIRSKNKKKLSDNLKKDLKRQTETMRCLKSCSIFKKGLKVLPKKCKNCFRKMKETNS